MYGQQSQGAGWAGMGQGMGDQSQMQGAYGGATGYDASSMGNRSGGRSSHQHGRTTMMERFVQGKYIRSDRPGRNSGAQSRRTERDEEKKRGFFVVSAHDDAVAQTARSSAEFLLSGPPAGGEEPKPEDIPFVTIQGMGRAATHAIAAAEAAKRLVRGSHSVTTVSNSVREQVWLPLEEGLDRVVIRQDVACITIILSCSPQTLATAALEAGAVSLSPADAQGDPSTIVGFSGPLPPAEVAGGPPGPAGLEALDAALRAVIEGMQVADPMQPPEMPSKTNGRSGGRGRGRGRGRGGFGGRGRGRGGGFRSDHGGFMGGITAGYGDPGHAAMLAAVQMQAAQAMAVQAGGGVGVGGGMQAGSPSGAYMQGGPVGPWGAMQGGAGGQGPPGGAWGWGGPQGGAPGSGGMVPGAGGAGAGTGAGTGAGASPYGQMTPAQIAQYQQQQHYQQQQQYYQQQQQAAYMQQQQQQQQQQAAAAAQMQAQAGQAGGLADPSGVQSGSERLVEVADATNEQNCRRVVLPRSAPLKALLQQACSAFGVPALALYMRVHVASPEGGHDQLAPLQVDAELQQAWNAAEQAGGPTAALRVFAGAVPEAAPQPSS